MLFWPYLLLGALLGVGTAGSLRAQIFELSGGASSLYGVQGASVLIHASEMDTSIGAGFLGGRFAAGGSAIHKISNGSLVAGQQEFGADLPTDVFDTSHIFFGTGVGLHEDLMENHSFNAFVGFSSAETGTPLFQSANVGKLAAFMQWKRPLSASCGLSSTISLTKSVSAFQSVQCTAGPKIAFAATVGTGGGARYEAVSARIKRRRFDLRASYVDLGGHFKRGDSLYQLTPEAVRENVSGEYRLTSTVSFSGLHQNYMTPSGDASVGTAATSSTAQTNLCSSLDEASVRYGRRQTGLGLTVLHSTLRQGATSGSSAAYSRGNAAYFATFSRAFGSLQFTESVLHSIQKNGESSSILINEISITINSHLRLTEAVNVTSSGMTLSHGGSLVTSRSSTGVDYQTLYLPNRPNAPFQQDLVFDTQLRLLRGVWLHAASSIGPTGKTLYTFRLGTIFAHEVSTAEPISAGGLGINVLRGRVVDPGGDPIEGAAVMVGPNHLYSDTQGYFFYREKVAHTHPFRVIPDEFIGVGSFVTVRAPSEVRTSSKVDAELILVVVVRSPESAPKATWTGPSLLTDSRE